jgi:hypothetical protein
MRYVITIAVLLISSSASAADPCEPYERFLDNPYVTGVGSCLFSLKRTFFRSPERSEFSEKLVMRALTDREHGNTMPGSPLDYSDLAELVALLNTAPIVDAMVRFSAKPGLTRLLLNFARVGVAPE